MFADFGWSTAEDEMIRIVALAQDLGRHDHLTYALLVSLQKYFEDPALCNLMFGKEDTLFQKIIKLLCIQVNFISGQYHNFIETEKN